MGAAVSKIVLFGATGYTGRLVAGALVAGGAAPLLAGRDRERLATMSEKLGGLETAVASVDGPESLRALLGRGDVLVSTVGPFAVHGEAAVRAAIETGAVYLDSSGEPGFIRGIFEREGPRAAGRAALAPAFGYDFVPGNLAGALALRSAGERAARLDVGYLLTGQLGLGSVSSGTLASIGGLLGEPSFAWRGGRIVAERSAGSVRSLPVRDRRRPAVSIGGSEHFALPRLSPALQEVNVYLGGFGQLAYAASAVSALVAAGARLPGAGRAMSSASARLARRSGRGPDEAARSRSGSDVVATAYDQHGNELATVLLEGPNSYTFTGAILAWAARHAAEHGVEGTGALGPVDAFGLEALEAGVTAAGFHRVPSAS
jgi:short subunit dehydrogenase-like uncharacterized protein